MSATSDGGQDPSTPLQAARSRGVDQLLHYTTQKGVHGTIASHAILSRAQLDDEDYLVHIREPVWPRKDPRWINHISLSVTTINDLLFSQSRYHYPHLWWAVFAIDPAILDDEGVVFTTTNNIFPAVNRAPGVDGFESMFAKEVEGRWGAISTRAGVGDAQPTDRAAEVLYPARIGSGHIQAVYVLEPDHRNLILAWCEALGHPDLAVEVRPNVFT